MFLLTLEDAQRARAEAREERREQRAHEIRLKEMEIEARRAAAPVPEMPASAAHSAAPVEGESPAEIKDLSAVPADIAASEVAEVASPPHPTSPHRRCKQRRSGGEEPEDEEKHSCSSPLPGGEAR